jgi:hypothetical protein
MSMRAECAEKLSCGRHFITALPDVHCRVFLNVYLGGSDSGVIELSPVLSIFSS